MYIFSRNYLESYRPRVDINMQIRNRLASLEPPKNINDFVWTFSVVQTRCGLTAPPNLSGAPPCVDSKQQMGMNMSSGSVTLSNVLLSHHMCKCIHALSVSLKHTVRASENVTALGRLSKPQDHDCITKRRTALC